MRTSLPCERGQGACSVAPQSATASLWHSRQQWPPTLGITTINLMIRIPSSNTLNPKPLNHQTLGSRNQNLSTMNAHPQTWFKLWSRKCATINAMTCRCNAPSCWGSASNPIVCQISSRSQKIECKNWVSLTSSPISKTVTARAEDSKMQEISYTIFQEEWTARLRMSTRALSVKKGFENIRVHTSHQRYQKTRIKHKGEYENKRKRNKTE